MAVNIIAFREEAPRYELKPGLHRMAIDSTYSLIRIYPFNSMVGDEGEFKGWMLSFETQDEFDQIMVDDFVDRVEDQLALRAMPTDIAVPVDPLTAEIAEADLYMSRTVMFSPELDERVAERQICREEQESLLNELGSDASTLEAAQSELKGMVYELKLSDASDINGAGLYEQLRYLYRSGVSTDDIRREIGLGKPSSSDSPSVF